MNASETMSAWILREFGGPDTFERTEIERPRVGPTDVLIEVHATSVNPVDFKI